MLSLDLGGPLIFDILLACTHLLVRLGAQASCGPLMKLILEFRQIASFGRDALSEYLQSDGANYVIAKHCQHKSDISPA